MKASVVTSLRRSGLMMLISSIAFGAAISSASAGKMNGKPGCSHAGCGSANYGHPKGAKTSKGK